MYGVATAIRPEAGGGGNPGKSSKVESFTVEFIDGEMELNVEGGRNSSRRPGLAMLGLCRLRAISIAYFVYEL